MNVAWRRLGSHETDHELIWLVVSIGFFGAAVIWFKLGLPWPICVFHDITGLPCMTCGATRCAIALFRGNLGAAWLWNPFVFVSLCGLILFDLYALLALLMRGPRLRIALRTESVRRFARFAIVAALTLNWIYLLSNWRHFS